MSSLNIGIRRKLTLMFRPSSLAHKLLMLMFMLMLASLVRTGLNIYTSIIVHQWSFSDSYWFKLVTWRDSVRPAERDYIQLFRQRLSHKSVKAYATMPIGIMGSKSLGLLDWGSRQFSNKEREKTNTCLCCFLLQHWNTLTFTQATVETTITHNNFRHCRVSFSPFVRQPFSKQL